MPSNTTSQRHPYVKFWPILAVLKTAKYRSIMLGVGLAYMTFYLFVSGIISYYDDFNAPYAPFARFTQYGINIIPANHIFIFAFYSAIAFMAVSSFLVGLNIALLFYSRNEVNASCSIKNVGPKGVAGILPAFFTSFNCCANGLLTIIFGSAAFSSLSLYGNYMAPATIVALAVGTYYVSSNISRKCK